MNEIMKQLIFHGSILLLIGLLAGAPYGLAILKKRSENTVHIWRMVHLTLPIGAILLFALASFITFLGVANTVQWTMAILFIVSIYAFGFAMIVGAPNGERGLTLRGPIIAKVAHIGHLVGVITSLVASIILVYAAWVTV